jgi:hypothetical protein
MREKATPTGGKPGPAIAGGAASNYTIRMSTRSRILLAIMGVAIACVSCAAIVYALWPLSPVREQITVWSNMFRMP